MASILSRQHKKTPEIIDFGCFFMQNGAQMEIGSFFYFEFDPILTPESVDFL